MVDIDKPLIDQFFDVVRQHPDRPAIEDDNRVWTYAELGDRVAWLAGEIPAGRPEEPVAIDLPYAAAFPWAMLACLAVGRPYVPLDRSAPAERNRAIMAAAGATFVVHDGTGALAGALPGVDVGAWTAGRRQRVSGVAGLAYILFTSGSTGKPKGVYQTQRGLLHDVRQYLETVRVRPDDRLSLLYSPGVNGAIRDIYGALLSGACLCLRDLRRHGIAGLDAWLEASGVTVYHSIPNIFRTMLAMRRRSEKLTGVRWVYLAGDRIFTSDYEWFKRFLPAGARLHVGIGATEAATIYRQWVLDGSEVIDEAFLPLGFAVEDRTMHLVDAAGQDVAAGEVGEIVVRSAFVAQGYWRDPVRTAERFTDQGDGTRTYATGDLGRLRPDGHLELVGRADRQLKIGGTRVEPGEVESALLAIDGVVRAAVLPAERADGSLRLVACVMVEESDFVTSERLRAHLRKQLPPAFVPAEVRVLAELPLMHNFKTDLAALRAMLQRSEARDDDRVARAWRGLLGHTGPLDADESWQDAGGDSLALAHLQVQLEAQLEKPLPPGLMVPDVTLAKLRSWIASCNAWRAQSAAEMPRVFMIPSLWGISPAAKGLMQTLRAAGLEVTAAQLPRALVNNEERRGFAEIWPELADDLQGQIQATAPHLLLAHCHGAAIALRLLRDRPDLRFNRVILIDPAGRMNDPDHHATGPDWARLHPIRAALLRQRSSPIPPQDRFASWLLTTTPAGQTATSTDALLLVSEEQMAPTLEHGPQLWPALGVQWPPLPLQGSHGEVLGPHNHSAVVAALRNEG